MHYIKSFSLRQSKVYVIGVTLLEIMLVLAIAAMIIVLSVRYYQSATTASQANAFLSQLQAIAVAADTLAIGANSYSNIDQAGIQSVVGEKGLITPWGIKMTITQAHDIRYSVLVHPGTIPAKVCELVFPRLANNRRWYNGDSGITIINSRDCSVFSDPNKSKVFSLEMWPDRVINGRGP